jgi:hypothetical protein
MFVCACACVSVCEHAFNGLPVFLPPRYSLRTHTNIPFTASFSPQCPSPPLSTPQSRASLPSFQNQDFGLTVWSLARLAAPLDEAFLSALVREAGKKWWSMDLEGMSLLMWVWGRCKVWVFYVA